MKKVWKFFDNLDEFVYICDLQTDELIYMNKKTLKTYGLESKSQLQGKKCYEVLHNSSTPCTCCINTKLKRGQFVEGKSYNPRIKRHLLTKDTIVEYNGRLYRLNLSIDVTKQEAYTKALKKYQDLETVVNEAIKTAMQMHNSDDAINIILEYLGKTLNGERTYVFEKNENNCDDNTYEWVAMGVTPQKENLQNIKPEICGNWYAFFDEGKPIVINDIEDIIEDNPKQYEILKAQNIKSIVVVPIYYEKKAIGFYGIDNPPLHDIDYVKNMLEITGHFIVAQIKNRDLIKELNNMSYIDQLTKIGNRHAMRKYVNEMNKSRSIGVVYCDITGLKRVNDTEGHAAGDALICKASEIVNEIYGDYGVFRIGGDEILALCSTIDEQEFNERSVRLKKAVEDKAVSMAIGTSWQSKSGESIREILHEAEQLMYADKAEYYKKMKIERRR